MDYVVSEGGRESALYPICPYGSCDKFLRRNEYKSFGGIRNHTHPDIIASRNFRNESRDSFVSLRSHARVRADEQRSGTDLQFHLSRAKFQHQEDQRYIFGGSFFAGNAIHTPLALVDVLTDFALSGIVVR
jgi:hypothetical protein